MVVSQENSSELRGRGHVSDAAAAATIDADPKMRGNGANHFAHRTLINRAFAGGSTTRTRSPTTKVAPSACG